MDTKAGDILFLEWVPKLSSEPAYGFCINILLEGQKEFIRFW